MTRLAAILVAFLLASCSVEAVEPAASPQVAVLEEPTQDPGEIGSASFGGTATWYCSATSACTVGYGPSDMVAAIDPTLGIPKGTRLTVHHEGRSVRVQVVDVCACGGTRIIDLSRLAFSRLADPSRGVIDVAIEYGGAVPTLPATGTEP